MRTYKTEGAGTNHVALASALNVLHGVRYAHDTDHPLNWEVIVAWHLLGIDDGPASVAFRALRRKVWCAWKYATGHALLDVAVHENPSGRFGELRNTHWAAHVTAGEEGRFRTTVTKYLRKVTGIRDLGAALLIRPVSAAGGLAKYMLKGVDPAFGSHLYIKPEPQGFIGGYGRTFVSRALSRAARKRAGWVRKRRPRPPPRGAKSGAGELGRH